MSTHTDTKLESCNNHFPVKQVRYKGIPHVGIKGKWVGRCQCGQDLEYTNDGVFHGWFTTDQKYIKDLLDQSNSTQPAAKGKP